MAAWHRMATMGGGSELRVRRAAFYLLSSCLVAAGRVPRPLATDTSRSRGILLHRILRGRWRHVHAWPQISFAALRACRSGFVRDQPLSPDHRVLGLSRRRNAGE